MMKRCEKMIRNLETQEAGKRLETLYGNDERTTATQRKRYETLIRRHSETFGERGETVLVSAPGRTEIGGNHTDHNH